MAEKAAWDYVENEGKGLELSVICPVGIFGPVLGEITSASLDIAVIGIINGTTKESGDFTMGIVDVRDVADIHIKAMESPKAVGERFIASSDGVISFSDVAELIKKKGRKNLRISPTWKSPRQNFINKCQTKSNNHLRLDATKP